MKEEGISIVSVIWGALIVLKAIGVLEWGWIVVLLFPIWFPVILGIAMFGVSLVCLFFILLLSGIIGIFVR